MPSADLRAPILPGQAGAGLAAKEKAPALSGRGSAVSAGRGEGMPITAGGEGRTSAPAAGSRKKCAPSIGGGGPGKRNASECVPRRFADSCHRRRLSPVPDSFLSLNRRFGKAPPRACGRPIGARARPASAISVNHIFGLDSGFGPRQSGGWGRRSRGESNSHRALGWGDSIEIA